MFPVKNDKPFKKIACKFVIILYYKQIQIQGLDFFLELTDRWPLCSAHQFLSGKINLYNIHLTEMNKISVSEAEKSFLKSNTKPVLTERKHVDK